MKLLKTLIMETTRTNKYLLLKGLKFMGMALAFMFTGPALAYISQTKLKSPMDSIILIIAITICIAAIYLGFKGINTILDSMFKKK